MHKSSTKEIRNITEVLNVLLDNIARRTQILAEDSAKINNMKKDLKLLNKKYRSSAHITNNTRHQVPVLVAQGKNNIEISELLKISRVTVIAIKKKFGLVRPYVYKKK